MNKKYELTDETMEYTGCTLHRIKALKDFSDVKKGDLGGWVKSEENLSQEGDCWVYDEAKVFNWAHVCDNATIHNESTLSYHVTVEDNAKVSGDTFIYDNVKVSGSSIVDDSRIADNAQVIGSAHVIDSLVNDNAIIKDDSVLENSYAGDKVIVGKKSKLKNVSVRFNSVVEDVILIDTEEKYKKSNLYITKEDGCIKIMNLNYMYMDGLKKL